MAQYFKIHPDNPQVRLLNQAALILRQGGVIAYPTDSCYALGCLPGDRSAFERILALRRLDHRHNFTLLCSSMTTVGALAKTDNTAFRLIKRLTPGPYTFLLRASRQVPRYIRHPKKKTVGLRIPAHDTLLALLELVGEPLLSTSLILPDNDAPETSPEEILRKPGMEIDLVIDAGSCGTELTTVIDLTSDNVEVVRQGLGSFTGYHGLSHRGQGDHGDKGFMSSSSLVMPSDLQASFTLVVLTRIICDNLRHLRIKCGKATGHKEKDSSVSLPGPLCDLCVLCGKTNLC